MRISYVSCDGEGCTERRESAIATATVHEYPLWVARQVIDARMDAHDTTRQASRVLHYCAECALELQPPLPADLLLPK